MKIDDEGFVLTYPIDYIADLYLTYRKELLSEDPDIDLLQDFCYDMNQIICTHRECEFDEEGKCRICG